MRRLLEDSKDDSSTTSSDNQHKPCPFEMSKDDGTSFDFEDQSEILSRHQQVSDELHQLSPSSESPLNMKVGAEVADEIDLEFVGTHPEMAGLQLRNKLKASSSTVCCIDAHSDPDVIDEWIREVEEVHSTRKRTISDQNELPNVQGLMQPWPREMEEALNSGAISLPPADIDMSLEEYATMMCSLFGIPVEQKLVESIHTMMSLYMEYKDIETSNDISVTVEEWN